MIELEARHQEELDLARTGHHETYGLIEARHESRLSELEQQHAEKLEAAETAIQGHEAKAAELEAKQAEAEQLVAERLALHAREVEDLEASHAARVEVLVANSDEERSARLAVLAEEHEYAIKEARAEVSWPLYSYRLQLYLFIATV